MTPQATPKATPKPRKKTVPAAPPAAPVKPAGSSAEALARRIAEIVDDQKGEAITVLDLRGLTDLADFFVIVTARSGAHMRAIIKNTREKLREEGTRTISPPEEESVRWSVLDYADVVMHVFDPEARDHYQLERAWGDADEIDWKTPAAPAKKPTRRKAPSA